MSKITQKGPISANGWSVRHGGRDPPQRALLDPPGCSPSSRQLSSQLSASFKSSARKAAEIKAPKVTVLGLRPWVRDDETETEKLGDLALKPKGALHMVAMWW